MGSRDAVALRKEFPSAAVLLEKGISHLAGIRQSRILTKMRWNMIFPRRNRPRFLHPLLYRFGIVWQTHLQTEVHPAARVLGALEQDPRGLDLN